jgi:hypothetical protein
MANKTEPGETPEWLQNLNGVSRSLEGLAAEVRALASGFYQTGNKEVALRLTRLSAEASQSSETISEATGQVVFDLVQQSGEASTNMLNAALAGVLLSERSRGQNES